jgi:hypothetical protein
MEDLAMLNEIINRGAALEMWIQPRPHFVQLPE